MVFIHCSLRNPWRPQRTLCPPLDCGNTAQRSAIEPPGRLCRTGFKYISETPKNIPMKTLFEGQFGSNLGLGLVLFLNRAQWTWRSPASIESQQSTQMYFIKNMCMLQPLPFQTAHKFFTKCIRLGSPKRSLDYRSFILRMASYG